MGGAGTLGFVVVGFGLGLLLAGTERLGRIRQASSSSLLLLLLLVWLDGGGWLWWLLLSGSGTGLGGIPLLFAAAFAFSVDREDGVAEVGVPEATVAVSVLAQLVVPVLVLVGSVRAGVGGSGTGLGHRVVLSSWTGRCVLQVLQVLLFLELFESLLSLFFLLLLLLGFPLVPVHGRAVAVVVVGKDVSHGGTAGLEVVQAVGPAGRSGVVHSVGLGGGWPVLHRRGFGRIPVGDVVHVGRAVFVLFAAATGQVFLAAGATGAAGEASVGLGFLKGVVFRGARVLEVVQSHRGEGQAPTKAGMGRRSEGRQEEEEGDGGRRSPHG